MRLVKETNESEIVRDGDEDGDRVERVATQARGSKEQERKSERRGREEVGSGRLGPLVWEYSN